MSYTYGKKEKPVQVGTLRVYKDYVDRQTGETACNYNEYIVHAGEYPVYISWHAGKRILYANMTASLIESYYVNRVFTATSIKDSKWEKGEKLTSRMWRWGDYNYSTHPPMAPTATGTKLTLLDGWIVKADYRGNYSGGRAMIFYSIEEQTAEKVIQPVLVKVPGIEGEKS